VKVGEVCFAEALDEVLLDTAGGGDDARYVLVLHEVHDDFAEAGGYEIRGVSEEDVAARSGAEVGVGTFLGFILRDWVIGEAPSTLRRVEWTLGLAGAIHSTESGGAHHFVHDVDCFTKAVCLETDTFIRVEQSVQRLTLVKVGTLYRDGFI
jgi:hypothetical protein